MVALTGSLSHSADSVDFVLHGRVYGFLSHLLGDYFWVACALVVPLISYLGMELVCYNFLDFP